MIKNLGLTYQFFVIPMSECPDLSGPHWILVQSHIFCQNRVIECPRISSRAQKNTSILLFFFVNLTK